MLPVAPRAGSILIDEVDQLAQPTVVAARKAKRKAGEILYFRFVVFIGVDSHKRKSSSATDIAEFMVNAHQGGLG